MRIAFDVSYIQKRRAGIGRYANELLAALMSEEDTSEFILHGWSFSFDRSVIESFFRANVSWNVAVLPGGFKRLYWDRLRFPRIQAFVGPIDIFHSCDPFLPPIGTAAGIATVYDLAFQRFPAFFRPGVISRGRFMSRSLLRAEKVIVPSLSTKQDVMEILGVGETKIHVLRPSVAPVFGSKGDPTADEATLKSLALSGPYALNVGTLEPRKNIVRLVSAFGDFHRRCPSDVQLVLVGKKGWFYDESLRAIESSPVRRRIRMLDYVSDGELAALYRSALFVVYPSLFEGHGFPVVEAMACGTPVITSSTSSLKEIGEGSAMLVDPTRTDELADAMTELYQDPSRRRELSGAGLVRAREFNREQAGKSLLELYDSIARR